MNLLTRLIDPHDAIAAVKAGTLLLTERANGHSVNGTALPVIALGRRDISRYRLTMVERGKYHSIIASFHDTETGKAKTASVGNGDPAFRIRHVHQTEQRATQAAHAKLKALMRGKTTLLLTLPGNPAIAAETQIRLGGMRPASMTSGPQRLSPINAPMQPGMRPGLLQNNSSRLQFNFSRSTENGAAARSIQIFYLNIHIFYM